MSKIETTHSCAFCGKHYETGRKDSKYCSASCRTQAYNARMNAAGQVTGSHKQEQIKPAENPDKTCFECGNTALQSTSALREFIQSKVTGKFLYLCPSCWRKTVKKVRNITLADD